MNLDDGRRGAGDTGPELGALLRDRAGDGRTLHLPLQVDNDACVVLKAEEDAVLAPVELALADDDGRHDLLTEVRLTLLDSANEEVAEGARGQSVEGTTDAVHGNDVQVLGTGVVRAIHDGTDRHRQGNQELILKTLA